MSEAYAIPGSNQVSERREIQWFNVIPPYFSADSRVNISNIPSGTSSDRAKHWNLWQIPVCSVPHLAIGGGMQIRGGRKPLTRGELNRKRRNKRDKCLCDGWHFPHRKNSRGSDPRMGCYSWKTMDRLKSPKFFAT
jgi:hypothetical protein